MTHRRKTAQISLAIPCTEVSPTVWEQDTTVRQTMAVMTELRTATIAILAMVHKKNHKAKIIKKLRCHDIEMMRGG